MSMRELIKSAFGLGIDRDKIQLSELSDRVEQAVTDRLKNSIAENVHATSELAQTYSSQNGMERFVRDIRYRG